MFNPLNGWASLSTLRQAQSAMVRSASISTPVWTIVCKDLFMFELLNGWAGSNLTRHAQKPKCPDEHLSLDEHVPRTVGVQTLERAGRTQTLHVRSPGISVQKAKTPCALTLQDSNLSVLIEHVKFRYISIKLSPNHHVRGSCGAQRESSRFRPTLNFT